MSHLNALVSRFVRFFIFKTLRIAENAPIREFLGTKRGTEEGQLKHSRKKVRVFSDVLWPGTHEYILPNHIPLKNN